MAQRRPDNLIASPVSGRAAVRVAVEDLSDQVARLARKLNRIAPTADKHGTPTREKARIDAALGGAFAATTCGRLPAAAEEAPLSLQRDRQTGEVVAGELVEEPSSNFRTSPPEPTQTRRQEENAIAGRVADLYERLGGFIKPSLRKPTDYDA
jgi:hypothetical protein